MSTQEPIARQSAAVQKMAEDWHIVTTLLGGTKAIRAAGEKYLPKWAAETDEAYQQRLNSATLFPAFLRTVDILAAKPFSKELTPNEDVPARLLPWLKNIDLQGKNLQTFAAHLFNEIIAYGISYVLVEFPKAQGIRTLQDEQASGIRPYFVHYSPWDVLGWRFESVGGIEKLTQLRLREYKTLPEGEFGEREVEQIRVLTPGAWQLFEKVGNTDKWVLADEGTTSLSDIPFVPFYGKRTGLFTGEPPMLELAYLNVKHYQSESDQQTILHVARVPILTVIGAEHDTNIVVGAASAVKLPPGADMKFVEHNGASISAGRDDIQDLEERMRQIGGELLSMQPGKITATQIHSEDSGDKSALQLIAEGVEDSLDQCLQHMAEWVREKNGGTVTMFKDFGVSNLTDASAQLLLTANMGGKLSDETLLSEFKRRGVVSPDVEFDDEQEKIKLQRPPLGMLGQDQSAA